MILHYKVMAVYTTKEPCEAETTLQKAQEALSGLGFTLYTLACNDDDSETIVGSCVNKVHHAPRPETRSEKLIRLIAENRARQETRKPRDIPLKKVTTWKRKKHRTKT
jgi:hypothetical protein